ncbi:SDR family NAD(P)-dependent oxidoreductase [Chloroflexota bacterium]
MNLEGRIAIVTGGSRGIGKGVVLALAKAGADVAFCYKQNEEAAKSTADEVESLRGRCLYFRADVADYEDVKDMVAKTVETFGSVDILVNNANHFLWFEEQIRNLRISHVFCMHIYLHYPSPGFS